MGFNPLKTQRTDSQCRQLLGKTPCAFQANISSRVVSAAVGGRLAWFNHQCGGPLEVRPAYATVATNSSAQHWTNTRHLMADVRVDARKYVNSSPKATVIAVGCKVHNVFIKNTHSSSLADNWYVDNNPDGDPDTTTMQLRGVGGAVCMTSVAACFVVICSSGTKRITPTPRSTRLPSFMCVADAAIVIAFAIISPVFMRDANLLTWIPFFPPDKQPLLSAFPSPPPYFL